MGVRSSVVELSVVAPVAAERGHFDTSTLNEPYRIEGKETRGAARAMGDRKRYRPHVALVAMWAAELLAEAQMREKSRQRW
ncbi:MAG: hypothetical protein ACREM6_12800 [Vulcanimicrobiaceae bacterium]